MKIRIGDKVRFLNEKGEGIVSRIQDSKTVLVEMEDGFEIPYLASQLVAIHTDLIIDKDADNIELNPDANIADAIYFIIEPDHELPELMNEYKLYLFNASSFNLLFTYSVKEDSYYQTLKNGNLGAYQKIFLKQVREQFFKEYNYHKVDAILYKNTHFRAQSPVSESFYIHARNLKNSVLIKHTEFNLPVYGFLIKDEFIHTTKVDVALSKQDIDKLKTIKEFSSKAKISKSHKEYLASLEKEIDLHIEELVENTNGMSNHEILSIQLEKFEQELDEAIAKGMKKLIFIHGVGNGKLKNEILSILNSVPEVTFQDGSYKEYGYGATQVNIK